MNERDDIAEYIGTLQDGEGLSETAIRDGYTRFQAEKSAQDSPPSPRGTASPPLALQTFVDGILDRFIFDGEQLGDLMAPLDLGWKARTRPNSPSWPTCPPPHQTRRRPRHLRTQRVWSR